MVAVVGQNGSLSMSTVPPPIPGEFIAEPSSFDGVTSDVPLINYQELVETMITSEGIQDVAYGSNMMIWVAEVSTNDAGGAIKAYDIKANKWSPTIGYGIRIALDTNNLPYIVNA